MHCIYLSDQLSVLAHICCLISVIGISTKSCISASLIITCIFYWHSSWFLDGRTSILVFIIARCAMCNRQISAKANLIHCCLITSFDVTIFLPHCVGDISDKLLFTLSMLISILKTPTQNFHGNKLLGENQLNPIILIGHFDINTRS